MVTRHFEGETKYCIMYDAGYKNIRFMTTTNSISTGREVLELFDTVEERNARLLDLGVQPDQDEI